jgi:hypothetical protein
MRLLFLEVRMTFTFALMRNAILVAALISSFVTSLTAQAVSANARTSESFTATVYPFEFHSGFSINLHHFVYEQALLRKRTNSVQTTSSATKSTNQLSSEQQQLWNTALDYYGNAMIKARSVA